jgi:hypothetical protein
MAQQSSRNDGKISVLYMRFCSAKLTERRELVTIIPQVIIIIIIIIIILGMFFMSGIYTYIPETNHVPREHCVATILM